MKPFIQQLLFLGIGSSFSILYDIPLAALLALLCAIILASFSYLYPKHILTQLLSIAYLLLAAKQHAFFCYLPLVIYCVYGTHMHSYVLLLLFPLLFHLQTNTLLFTIQILAFSILALAFKQQQIETDALKLSYIQQRDASKEAAVLLSDKNRSLLVQQEQELRIAILNERNRIARDIHDHVGHLLSSSLLQIGALQAIVKDPALQEPLQNLQTTLSQGMDNVRNSVHELHKDAIDLPLALQRLLQDYTFCKTSLEYDLLQPLPQQMTYHILAIVKESMNNTMRHSNATWYQILLREQPAFYQLILQDNGTRQSTLSWKEKGMGLENMQERVHQMHGYINIHTNAGFQIFITLPKEVQHEDSDHRR